MLFNRNKSKPDVYFLSSKLLGREVPLQIILPSGIVAHDSPRPVLYLLHGLFGRFDNWAMNTGILDYAKKHEFAIVCVEGGDNWYVDNPQLENHFYESYVLEELISAVEKQFEIGQSRAKRAIAGLSMGGYGAFKAVFRRPEKFCFAASMSGAFHAAEIRSDDDWKELQSSIQAVFGEDSEIRNANDLFRLIENFPVEKISELPYFYFDCGSEDSFLPINRKLSEALKKRGIAHEFHIFSGGHDWIYWNSQLDKILQKTSQMFFGSSK